MSYKNAPGHLNTQEMYYTAMLMEPHLLALIPNHLKFQEICKEAVQKDTYTLGDVPDHLKTQKTCNKAVEVDPWQLKYVPEDFITREMCNKVVGDCSWQLEYVPKQHKTREMCNKAVSSHNLLQNVLNWFVGVIQQKIKIWYNTGSFCDDNLIEWCNGYQKWKVQKAKIKEELLPITWHPDRVMNWCMSEDEKKETEQFWK